MKKGAWRMITLAAVASSMAYAGATIRVAVPSYGESTKPAFEKMVADFEKANPDIKVKLEVGSWSAWQQKLQTDFFSGGNADVIYSTRGWVPSYVAGDKLAALDGLLPKEFLSKFPQSLLDAAKVNGKLYALPSVTSARNLYVNMDLLKKAGIDHAPTTWDELAADAKAVADKTDAAGYGIQGKEVEMEKYFYYILWNMDGSVLNKTIDGDQCTLDNPAGIKAASFYDSMIKQGATQKNVVSYNREDLQALFKQGKLAMMITHGLLAKQMGEEGQKIHFVQTDVPGMGGKKGVTLGVIDAVHLSKNSKAKAEAVKFMMFSMKPKYQADWIAKAGLLPVTTEAGKEKAFDKPYLQAMIAAVPNAKFTFIHAKSTKIIDIVKNKLQGLYGGKLSAEEAMKSACKKINRAVKH